MGGFRAVWQTLRRPRVADSALAGFVFLGSLGPLIGAADPDTLRVQIPLAVVASGVLIRRRDRPFAVLVGTMLPIFAMHFYLPATSVPALAGVIAVYSVGRYGSPRYAWPAALVTGLGQAGLLTSLHVLGIFFMGPADAPLWPLLLVAGAAGIGPSALAVAVGYVVRLRHELRERIQAERAAAAVRSERQRIARELHDVVAHHISAMSVLVGAARTSMTNDPDRARTTLTTAERSGRAAMAEMRQLLHVLRADDPEGGPVLGIDALPRLVDHAREAGQPVRLEVTGDPAELPSAVDHAVYRIVQEALTNTRKHANGARASIRLRYEPDAVQVEVIDDGPAVSVPAGQGYGLDGMAERVAVCGGRLHTGPRAEGGFRVHARFPLDQGAGRR